MRSGETRTRDLAKLIHTASATTTTIQAIPAQSREDGMMVVCLADSSVWIFDSGSSAGASSTVLVPDAGSGRWLQLAFSDGMAASDLASTSNGEGASLVGVEDAGALFAGADVEAVLAEIGGLGIRRVSQLIGHADLTTASTTETENVGSALPAKSMIVGYNFKLATPFSGGSVSALVVDIGTSDDVDAIIDGADMFTAAVDGQASLVPLGIAPNKYFATSKQLTAKFTATGDNVVNLSAGSVTIEILYIVFP